MDKVQSLTFWPTLHTRATKLYKSRTWGCCTLCLKNVPLCDCPYSHQILTDFQNPFTATLSGEFVIVWLLNIPPHFNCVATLPWKRKLSKSLNHLNHSNACKKVLLEQLLPIYALKLNGLVFDTFLVFVNKGKRYHCK